MTWYVRARHVGSASSALLVALILVAISGGTRVPVPSLVGGAQVGLPLAAMAPLVVLASLGPLVAAARRPGELVALRPTRWFDVTWMLVFVAAFIVATAVFWQLTDDSAMLVAGRNFQGLLGVALLVNYRLGVRAALVVPPAWLLGSTLVGTGLDGGTRWWAWPIADAANVTSVLLSVGLLVTGLVVHVTHPRSSE